MKNQQQFTSRGKAISIVSNDGEQGIDNIVIQDGKI